jgi:hypothetical protein
MKRFDSRFTFSTLMQDFPDVLEGDLLTTVELLSFENLRKDRFVRDRLSSLFGAMGGDSKPSAAVNAMSAVPPRFQLLEEIVSLYGLIEERLRKIQGDLAAREIWNSLGNR